MRGKWPKHAIGHSSGVYGRSAIQRLASLIKQSSTMFNQTAALPIERGVFSAWHGTADLTKDGVVHYPVDVPWERDKVDRLLSDVVLI